MAKRKKGVAQRDEILRFYTCVMRGEEDGITISNRISAADRLLEQLSIDDGEAGAYEKLDEILGALKAALRDGITADDDAQYPADEREEFVMPAEEDDDEDEQ